MAQRGDVVKEIRWHARAGQGAKTAAQVFAVSAMRAGKSVQAFPEYGPERRGAPMRAYTRIDDKRIRRHDSVTNPDVVVVLEPSLLHETDVTEGLASDGFVLLNAEAAPAVTNGTRYLAVPATRIAAAHSSTFSNVVMAGALAAAIGEPSVDDVAETAVEMLGKKVPADSVRDAVYDGYRWLS
jgi:pyruvate ferredoxin oxidoreductase gamma subunit